ncbi:hypothetical protein B0H11DRAFT_1912712 [Mycena galericulata]|nr:hypothetical protein B0H11DRAFT_1912712 [Mycena galericulata]
MSVYVNGILAPSWSCSGLAHSSVFAASLCVPPVASWAFLVSVDAGQYGVHSMTLICEVAQDVPTLLFSDKIGFPSYCEKFAFWLPKLATVTVTSYLVASPSTGGTVSRSSTRFLPTHPYTRIPTFVETNGASRLHFTPTVINHPIHVPFEAIRFKSDAPNTSKSLSSSYPSPLNVSSLGSNIYSSSSRVPSELIKITPLQPRSRKVGSGSTPSWYKSPRLIDGQRFLAAYLPSPNPSQNLFPAGKPELERLLKGPNAEK